MSTARERIQAYLDRIDASNAKSSLKYHDTIHGLDDVELTRTDLRALLAETAEPHTFDTDECVTRERKCAPTEDVREALARALYDIDPLPLHRGEGNEERIVGPKPWDWLLESYREHLRSLADAILTRFHVTPKEEQ